MLTLQSILLSLNLPGSLQALEKPLGLPSSLVSHAEEVRQQNGLHKLRRSIYDVEKLKTDDRTTYEEGVKLLESEASEDERAKLKYGSDRWTRQPSKQAAERLYTQVNEIEGYLQSAHSSDELVKNKLKECESVVQVLEGSDRELLSYVPSSRRVVMTPKVEEHARKLREILSNVNQLERARRQRIENLKEKARKDDISKLFLKTQKSPWLTSAAKDAAILAETARLERDYPMQKIEPAQFEELFEARLEEYDDDRLMISDQKEEQEQLLSKLQEVNKAFVNARRGDNSTRERAQALQRLENAYLKYKEIISNLDTGRKFYNDLANIVNRFRDDCKDFRYQRRVEAGQLET